MNPKPFNQLPLQPQPQAMQKGFDKEPFSEILSYQIEQRKITPPQIEQYKIQQGQAPLYSQHSYINSSQIEQQNGPSQTIQVKMGQLNENQFINQGLSNNRKDGDKQAIQQGQYFSTQPFYMNSQDQSSMQQIRINQQNQQFIQNNTNHPFLDQLESNKSDLIQQKENYLSKQEEGEEMNSSNQILLQSERDNGIKKIQEPTDQKKGICHDNESQLFILSSFVEPIYDDFVYLTETILNKTMKSANKQLQDTLMNYFLENHVSNLIIKDMNCISKRAVRFEIEKTMIKTRTAKYMNLLNAFESKVRSFSKDKSYENLLMQLITDENSGSKNSEQWKTLVRKRILALLLYIHWQTPDADTIFNDFFAIWDKVYPNHPLPQKIKKQKVTHQNEQNSSHHQQSCHANNAVNYQNNSNKSMKRNKQKVIDSMNLSQSSLISQFNSSISANNSSQISSLQSSSVSHQLTSIPTTQSGQIRQTAKSTSSTSEKDQKRMPNKISQENQNSNYSGQSQNYQYLQQFQQYQPSDSAQKGRQNIPQYQGQAQLHSNQRQDAINQISLQSSTSAFYPSQQNIQQGQWIQPPPQYEYQQPFQNNMYPPLHSNDQEIYEQGKYLQAQQLLPSSKPANQVFKGRMRSQSWDDGSKREDERILINQQNTQQQVNGIPTRQPPFYNPSQPPSIQSQSQFYAQNSQQYYNYEPSINHPSDYFDPSSTNIPQQQQQQGYYVDYSSRNNLQQVSSPSNSLQQADLQQFQQRQLSQGNFQIPIQNNFFPQQQQNLQPQYQSNLYYNSLPQYQQIQKIPFFNNSAQIYDIQEVKQEGTPSSASESGSNKHNNSNSKQLFQMDKIILYEIDSPNQRMQLVSNVSDSQDAQYQYEAPLANKVEKVSYFSPPQHQMTNINNGLNSYSQQQVQQQKQEQQQSQPPILPGSNNSQNMNPNKQQLNHQLPTEQYDSFYNDQKATKQEEDIYQNSCIKTNEMGVNYKNASSQKQELNQTNLKPQQKDEKFQKLLENQKQLQKQSNEQQNQQFKMNPKLEEQQEVISKSKLNNEQKGNRNQDPKSNSQHEMQISSTKQDSQCFQENYSSVKVSQNNDRISQKQGINPMNQREQNYQEQLSKKQENLSSFPQDPIIENKKLANQIIQNLKDSSDFNLSSAENLKEIVERQRKSTKEKKEDQFQLDSYLDQRIPEDFIKSIHQKYTLDAFNGLDGNMSQSHVGGINTSIGGSPLGSGGEEKYMRNNQRQNTGASNMSIESDKFSFRRTGSRNMTGMSNISIESDKEGRTPQSINRSKFYFRHQSSLEAPPLIGMRSIISNGTEISNPSENINSEFGSTVMQSQFFLKRSNLKQFSGISHISMEGGEYGQIQMRQSGMGSQGFNIINRSQLRKRTNLSVDSLANFNIKQDKDLQNLSFDLENLSIHQQENGNGLNQYSNIESLNVLEDQKGNNLFFTYPSNNDTLL